jgi:hypothetical protein
MRFTSPSRALIATFALALGLSACASGGGGGGGTPRGSSTRIIGEELATVAQLDLYTAVSRLRPQWLRPGTRGQLPEVIVDGTRQQGGADVLRSMRANEVSELQFMSASDATTRYGTGFTAGAIIVSTRR